MQETVITIVASEGVLTPEAEKSFAGKVKAAGAENLGIHVLHINRAIDIIVPGFHAGLTASLNQKLQNQPGFDIFIQDKAQRRKSLLVADMDATIVEEETLDELAAQAGLKDKVAPITAAAMRGEIDFPEALRQRVAMLKGMPVSMLSKVADAANFSKGAASLVKTMSRHGATCVLVSGGFDFFTGHVAAKIGFHKNFGNRLDIANDMLTGEVIPPIVDKFYKKKTVEAECRALGISPEQAMAVGDGANDIPMLQTAGAGVGYFAKPAVQAATPFQIRYTDLTAMLYMQGYRKEDIAFQP